MVDEIKFKKSKKTTLQIDGLSFDEPKNWTENIWVGFCGLLIVISFPLWIIPYLFSKIIKIVSKKKLTGTLIYKCPSCDSPIEEIGSLFRIKCDVCGWDGYLDHIDKKTEIKRPQKN